MEGGGRQKKKGEGQGYFRLARGRGVKPFRKKLRGCLQFEVHFKSGPLSKVGKTVKSRAQAIHVKQLC